MHRRYIIYSPGYKENSGGIIALHNLCNTLNHNGYNSIIFYKKKYYRTIELLLKALLKFFGFKGRGFLDYKYLKFGVREALSFTIFKKIKGYSTPAFSGQILEDDIVIYPETTNGNPLKSKNVVRWFLYKPGAISGKINYGVNELYFFFQEVFNDENINNNKTNLLQLIYVMDDVFYNNNKKEREGTCYAIRKGNGKQDMSVIKDSVIIDNLSLKKIAKVFNKNKFFVSYDTQTFLSYYAVMCGCISVVIPDENISIDEWQPVENMRYGIAYGYNQIEYAINTKELLFENIARMKNNNNFMVNNFVEKCNEYFKK